MCAGAGAGVLGRVEDVCLSGEGVVLVEESQSSCLVATKQKLCRCLLPR